jgi:hypothetical protein
MTNDELKDAVLREARATVQRLAGLRRSEPADEDDALLKWDRLRPQPEPTQHEQSLDIDWRSMFETFRAEIVELIAQERDTVLEAVGSVVGDLQGDLAKLSEQLGSLKADQTVDRAYRQKSDPLDVPQFLSSRVQ